jgi:hypothetical protein
LLWGAARGDLVIEAGHAGACCEHGEAADAAAHKIGLRGPASFEEQAARCCIAPTRRRPQATCKHAHNEDVGATSQIDDDFDEEELKERAADAVEARTLTSYLLLTAVVGDAEALGINGPTDTKVEFENFNVGLLGHFCEICAQHNGQAPLRLLPSVTSPARLLQWMVVPIEAVLAEAARDSRASAHESADAGGAGKSEIVFRGSPSSTSSDAAASGALAFTALDRLLAAAPHAQLTLRASSSGAGELNATARPRHESEQLEIRLVQSAVIFIAHSPFALAVVRAGHLATLQRLISAFAPSARLQVLSRVIESCPYPHVAGILIDRVRSDVAAALRLRPSQSEAESRPRHAFLSSGVGALVMAIAHSRLEQGLLAPRELDNALNEELRALAMGASAGLSLARAESVSRHLERLCDVDVALLSLLRLMLLARIAGLPGQTDLCLLRDSYARPLVAGAAAAQTALRDAEGGDRLRSHPAPFDARPNGVANEHARPIGRGLATATPPGGARGAALSRLLVLDAAAVPALEVLEQRCSESPAGP